MVSRETPGPAPDLPAWLVGRDRELAEFTALLAGAGVERGLIGPREVPRLWQRHVLNCAVVADPAEGLVPEGSTVGDVGSGAGLPGLVWAISRPDLRVVLIEPLLRRSTFLQEAVDHLGLGARVIVWRGRAEGAGESVHGLDVVTARAVAPLDRLLDWTVPLLRHGGRVVALKGSSAPTEVEGAAQAIARWDLRDLRVVAVGSEWVDPPTTVVVAQRGAAE
ncbi:MAG TPA: 16S rRNA (guanine(527)-N(7))-methyltransferase RsmG [Actinobacteria bacterium]|jgi:16S rRNA (guanine527-N7)-methyltransferase|nr:16S rRNA (guanine(527)-N(7))-methyltransferase RsmG [Actinomycetota bacterium]